MPFDARRPSWWLSDGEKRAREAPRSFFVPPREHRDGLIAGRLVKLEFVGSMRIDGAEGRPVERMWVEVTGLSPSGQYVGRLDNDPTLIRGLYSDESVLFTARHVIAIDYDDHELGYDPAETAVVDPTVVRDDTPPTRVSRFHPPGHPLPMWFMGIDGSVAPESDLVTLGRLTDLWPELAPVFAAGEGDWLRHPDEPRYLPESMERRQALALTTLAEAARRCLAQADDLGGASRLVDSEADAAQVHFSNVLDAVVSLHWPGRGELGTGTPDGIRVERFDMAGGRVELAGTVWVLEGAERRVEADVSPVDGGTVRIGSPIGTPPKRRWGRPLPTPPTAWVVAVEVPPLAGLAGN